MTFHHTVEATERLAHLVLKFRTVKIVDDGFVIFINQDDNLATCLPVGSLNHVPEADSGDVRIVLASVFPFPFAESVVKYLFNHILLIVGYSAQV